MTEPKNQGPVARPQWPEGRQGSASTAKTQETQEYLGWLQATSKRYRQSQIKAAVRVNEEMLRFYWELLSNLLSKYKYYYPIATKIKKNDYLCK